MSHHIFSSVFLRAVAAAALLSIAGAASAAELVASIANIQTNEGQVMIGLFNSAADFPKQPFQKMALPASARDANGNLRVTFTDVPDGRYVVSAIHDRDANGKLTTNMMGIPSEPYGFSGTSSATFGPPKYEESAVDFAAGSAAILVTIK